jgi:hypothetical protein
MILRINTVMSLSMTGSGGKAGNERANLGAERFWGELR